MADEPIIYLYPKVKTSVKVLLHFDGKLDYSYPAYDPILHGWTVTAFPDGHLINNEDNRSYAHLFWEGTPSHANFDMTKGFVVAGSDTIGFLQKILAQMGLQPKEYNDFIVYWLPKMRDNKYNLIHFAGSEYEAFAHLSVSPTPDSTLRVFMVFTPLQAPVNVTPQTFPSFNRSGFSVIEWGGTELSN